MDNEAPKDGERMEWYKYTKYSKWTKIPEKTKKEKTKLPDIQISPTRKDKIQKTI